MKLLDSLHESSSQYSTSVQIARPTRVQTDIQTGHAQSNGLLSTTQPAPNNFPISPQDSFKAVSHHQARFQIATNIRASNSQTIYKQLRCSAQTVHIQLNISSHPLLPKKHQHSPLPASKQRPDNIQLTLKQLPQSFHTASN